MEAPMTLAMKSEETRQKLIESAGQIFAEVGYNAATVRQITDRAGANIASINYHFGDKLQLYRCHVYSNPGPKLMQGKRIVSSLYLYPGKLQQKLRPGFMCNSPGFQCSDNAPKSRKRIENKQA